MRICIPVTTRAGLDAHLYTHFGSAPFYAIAETTTGAVMTVSNADCAHKHGECAPVDTVSHFDIDAVVCSGMGRRAYRALCTAGIEVMLSEAVTVEGVLAAIRDNAVTTPNEEDMCRGHGHADRVGD
jgi:predicted Fe-Mo cluster-binding NifX family protein